MRGNAWETAEKWLNNYAFTHLTKPSVARQSGALCLVDEPWVQLELDARSANKACLTLSPLEALCAEAAGTSRYRRVPHDPGQNPSKSFVPPRTLPWPLRTTAARLVPLHGIRPIVGASLCLQQALEWLSPPQPSSARRVPHTVQFIFPTCPLRRSLLSETRLHLSDSQTRNFQVSSPRCTLSAFGRAPMQERPIESSTGIQHALAVGPIAQCYFVCGLFPTLRLCSRLRYQYSIAVISRRRL